jgi:S-adenosylmethionine hydrolase
MATVTLTTDFGDGSSYVAAMKGALLAVNPAARLLDLTHRIPPQDLKAAAYFLADTLSWFPAKTIHVVVVDPGVGTDRALLCVEWAGQIILVPDNGCWTPILRPIDPPPRVYRLEQRRFWRPDVSATFHGRDILAPVAGHLSLGVAPVDLGPAVSDWTHLSLPQSRFNTNGILGEVVIVDRFGNLLTNITVNEIPSQAAVQIDGRIGAKPVKTYGDAEPGTLVALIGSAGRLEIAVVNGSAADRLCLGLGAAVEFRCGE